MGASRPGLVKRRPRAAAVSLSLHDQHIKLMKGLNTRTPGELEVLKVGIRVEERRWFLNFFLGEHHALAAFAALYWLLDLTYMEPPVISIED